MQTPTRAALREAARARLAAELEAYFVEYRDQAQARRVPPMGVQATVGLGKSFAVTNVAAACAAAGLPLLVLVPTHKLAQEYIDRFEQAGVEALHYHGRQEPGNAVGEAWTCWKKEATEAAGNRNHRIANSVCKTCPHGLRVSAERMDKNFEKSIRFFKEKGLKKEDFSPCRFLYDALPAMLEAPILVMPIQSFSEAAAVWVERSATGVVENETQRLIVVDEGVELASSVDIHPGDVAAWRNSLPGLQASLDKQTRFLSGKPERTTDEDEELAGAQALLALVPALDALFSDLTSRIATDKGPDAQALSALFAAVKKAGAMHAGTARWERIGYTDAGDFYIPLRALTTIASNAKAGTLKVSKNRWTAFEVAGVVDWAARHGSTIFLDATMSLPMRAIITAAGGHVHEAAVQQNQRVTRYTGHLYARGLVGTGEYQRAALTYMRELERIAESALPWPAAIITHKAWLKYSVEHCQADSAALDAKADFEDAMGGHVRLGWFGGHDRGHNEYQGHHIAIIGMPLISPDAVASGYAQARAALLQVGVEWPEGDEANDDGKASQGVPLPAQAMVRAWLLDAYAATLAQAIGRNRSANHDHPDPLQVQLWGGLDTPEMAAALQAYGVHIDERLPNPTHRSQGDYYSRGTDARALDVAIDMAKAAGNVSKQSVRAALGSMGGAASNSIIELRIRELRESGEIPPKTKGGRPKKPGRDAYFDQSMQGKEPIVEAAKQSIDAQKWDEAYNERAGVLEFQAGLSRQTAELAAREMVTTELGPRPKPARPQPRAPQERHGAATQHSL